MWKYKFYLFLVLVIGISGMQFAKATPNKAKPLDGKIIYLDAGHGGSDPGALYRSIKEKDINLNIVKKLQKQLESLGARVLLTRYDDYDLSITNTINHKRSDLSRRGNLINRSKCDMYLSIHLNAEASSNWHGAEAYYDDINPKNEKIAKIMQEQFKEKLYSRRKYKKTDSLYLSKRINRPGVLLEMGFLSNANDRYLLKSDAYQEKVASVITDGIKVYFSVF